MGPSGIVSLSFVAQNGWRGLKKHLHWISLCLSVDVFTTQGCSLYVNTPEERGYRMRVALIGTRGVPANYGGFETCVEEVGKRLVAKGHEVTVYCRKSNYDFTSREYQGMQRVTLPNVRRKTMDTLSHSMLSVLHSLFQPFDVYVIFNCANSICALPLRLCGKNVVIHPDGLEWKRAKWGWAGSTFFKLSEKIACRIANRLVTDASAIYDYYLNKHNMDSTLIAYGANIQNSTGSSSIQQFGLEPGEYFLQITRFEPENHPLLTLKAFNQLRTDKKLVLVGGVPYPNNYTRQIEKLAGPNTLLLGFQYDQTILRDLWCNCFAYIHGNSAGGTNPALLQSMGSGCFTIASDVSFNRDALGEGGIYYDIDLDDLTDKMQWALDNPDKLVPYKFAAQRRISEYFSWDIVTDQYEQLFLDLLDNKFPWSLKKKGLMTLAPRKRPYFNMTVDPHLHPSRSSISKD